MTDEQPTARSLRQRLRNRFSRTVIGRDALAGLVLGVESVPDGLAAGLLAGLNPVSGLYAYLFGMVGAAFFTSSSFMAVQATGAMSLVVADTAILSRPDPAGALVTLGLLTGVIMVVVGLLRGGRLLRVVPTAVMTGFITAVGVKSCSASSATSRATTARGPTASGAPSTCSCTSSTSAGPPY